MDKTPILYQTRAYDEVTNYTSVDALKKSFPNPTDIRCLYQIYADGQQENGLAALVEAQRIKTTIFDEAYLAEYARLKVSENKSFLWEFGIHEQEINGRRGSVAGSAPTRHLTESEIIAEYKRLNHFSWA